MVTLFNFEQSGGYPLRRIPMIIRFRLDLCGLRISLAAWQALSREEREELVAMAAASEDERTAWCARLAAMLLPYADDPERRLEHTDIDPSPLWKQTEVVPQDVNATLNELSHRAITQTQWAMLSDLQRFALTKLTRRGHKNANLQPALQEFGLM